MRLRTIHFTKNGGGCVCYLGFIGPVSISIPYPYNPELRPESGLYNLELGTPEFWAI